MILFILIFKIKLFFNKINIENSNIKINNIKYINNNIIIIKYYKKNFISKIKIWLNLKNIIINIL